MGKIIHLMAIPFTGLGLYQGFRGNRWLKNRIKVFEQFVVPSLLNQTNKDFIVWLAWRREEKFNPIVKELQKRLEEIKELRFVHTFSGIFFYDDKYEDAIAKDRLVMSLHGIIGEIVEVVGPADEVYETIQPSDDLYAGDTVERIHKVFADMPEVQACGFSRGYIMDYRTRELAEYNPHTNPPFFTIRFQKDDFINPLKHIEYLSIKKDVGKYKVGTPYPSHEYLGDALRYYIMPSRQFLVGIHGENISTVFNHPFRGNIIIEEEILERFGIKNAPKLIIQISWRKKLLSKLPHKWQKISRYIFGEKIFNKLYNWLRA